MAKPAAPSLNESMKAIAGNLINKMQMCNIMFGTVTNDNPLEITTSQKNPIPAQYLVLSNAVKDHVVDMTISWQTVENTHKHGNGNNGQPTDDATHLHAISGRKKVMLHYGLTIGENVILLRETGGQRYVVLDRISDPITEGENI